MSKKQTNYKVNVVLSFIIIGISVTGFCFSCNSLILDSPTNSQYTSPVTILNNTELQAYLSGQTGPGDSWETPYIIENLQIDAVGSGAGLRIENVNLHLIIRNSEIISSVSGPYTGGIQLENCSNVRIENNEVSGFHNGVFVIESSQIDIIDNNANDAIEDGIHVVDSSLCIIRLNDASSNTWYGITIKRSTDNIISDNIVNENLFYGIYLEDSDSNVIRGNTIKNNILDGIYLLRSDANTVTRNVILGNGDTIRESNSIDNEIENNKTNYNLEIVLGSIGGALVIGTGLTVFFILRKKKRG